MSSDLRFITNEPGKHLRDRFGVLLGDGGRCNAWMPPAVNGGSFNTAD